MHVLLKIYHYIIGDKLEDKNVNINCVKSALFSNARQPKDLLACIQQHIILAVHLLLYKQSRFDQDTSILAARDCFVLPTSPPRTL